DPLAVAALLGNVLEMDDVHRAARLHPGPVVWPAALMALAETGAGMDALLDAGVRGYEAMIGVGASFDAHHYAHWHNTASAGGFGAAAAAGSVHGLSPAQLADALGNAGSMAGGLWHMRHDDVMTKQLHVGHAAFTGAWLARLAKAGMTGPRAVLEGPQGLYAAMTRAPLPLVLADGWRIGEISFKPWAACRHAHPAIDCALELRARGELTPPFTVETYADAMAFCDNADPVTEAQAKFSLQHAVAVIAAGRDATPADFTPAAIAALAPLRAQVRVAAAADISARYPAHFGARLHAAAAMVELTDTRGDPERPLGAADIVAKLQTLVAWGGLAPGEADRAAAVALDGTDGAALAALLADWCGA
ncbi:MAG: MmgE/PrpD family protein, partial [Polymorphobacter sp.]